MSDRTGIHKHGAGWRAVVSQGRNRPQLRKHFPASATFAEMQAWRADQRAVAHVRRKARSTRGSFDADAKVYLKTIAALPTLKDRTRQIQVWIAEFGSTPRDRITARDIRECRDRWLKAPRGYVTNDQGEDLPLPPLAPATVNLRLRALSNLYRVLDGPRAENPVRDVEEAREPSPRPRDIDYPTIQRILDALDDHGRAAKGQKRVMPSLSKIRLRIMAYTGLPPAQLGRLRRADVDFEARRLRLPQRQKGRGVDSELIPLLPHAVQAFRDLDAAHGWGPFSQPSVHKSFRRACKAAKVAPLRPYDLRHSFLTIVYEITGSLEAVMAFAQHADRKTALRYTQRAAAKLLHGHLAKLEAHFEAERLG